MSAPRMEPGRELDALVAETVMGWRVNRCGRGGWRIFAPDGTPLHLDGHSWYSGDLPPLSTEVEASRLVVERLRTLSPHPWMLTLQNWSYYGDVTWTATFTTHPLGPPPVEGCAATESHAICLAALKAACASLGTPPTTERG